MVFIVMVPPLTLTVPVPCVPMSRRVPERIPPVCTTAPVPPPLPTRTFAPANVPPAVTFSVPEAPLVSPRIRLVPLPVAWNTPRLPISSVADSPAALPT